MRWFWPGGGDGHEVNKFQRKRYHLLAVCFSFFLFPFFSDFFLFFPIDISPSLFLLFFLGVWGCGVNLGIFHNFLQVPSIHCMLDRHLFTKLRLSISISRMNETRRTKERRRMKEGACIASHHVIGTGVYRDGARSLENTQH